MLRFGAMAFLVLSSLVWVQAVAAADCQFCLNTVAVQTRDGQPWIAGQPITLVVRVADNVESALPATAQVVVMQTDGDRTKCLGVPLKLVQSDASGGVYAGLFFPFHPARYDGVLVVGHDVQSIRFDVNQVTPGAAPAGDLPAAEPIDTSPPRVIPFIDWPVAAVVGMLAMGLVLALVAANHQRHSPQSLAS
jgi:hypothetical protein